jgi:hypothetical protein
MNRCSGTRKDEPPGLEGSRRFPNSCLRPFETLGVLRAFAVSLRNRFVQRLILGRGKGDTDFFGRTWDAGRTTALRSALSISSRVNMTSP